MVQKKIEDLHSSCQSVSKDKNFKSGYVSIVGLPNAGKSTLLNTIIGSKVAIVSDKPQTTRKNVVGIYTTKNSQILFVDTPGLHLNEKKINRFLMDEALRSIQDSDVVIYLFDSDQIARKGLDSDKFFLEKVFHRVSPEKLIPVISKVDLVRERKLITLTEELKEFKFVNGLSHLSIFQNIGLPVLMEKVVKLLPLGPQYYPDDYITDKDTRFLCAEIIREKVFIMTSEEIPYSTAIDIEEYQEGETLHKIAAIIYVERDSQKGIIIGKKGSMLKNIGTEARLDMEKLLGVKVFLELFVKVKKDWTNNDRALEELGYNK